MHASPLIEVRSRKRIPKNASKLSEVGGEHMGVGHPSHPNVHIRVKHNCRIELLDMVTL